MAFLGDDECDYFGLEGTLGYTIVSYWPLKIPSARGSQTLEGI